MEMTRRKFFQQLFGAAIAITLGAKWLIKKTVPRRFVKALRINKYPGSLRPLGDVDTQSKWNG
jgi:hypothetical protein